MKDLSALLVLCAAFYLFNITNVLAQDETEPTTVSNLTDANLLWDAQRILPNQVPTEFNGAFENFCNLIDLTSQKRTELPKKLITPQV